MKYFVLAFFMLLSQANAMEIDPDCDSIDVRDLRISCAAAVFHNQDLCSHIESEIDHDYCIKVSGGRK